MKTYLFGLDVRLNLRLLDINNLTHVIFDKLDDFGLLLGGGDPAGGVAEDFLLQLGKRRI